MNKGLLEKRKERKGKQRKTERKMKMGGGGGGGRETKQRKNYVNSKNFSKLNINKVLFLQKKEKKKKRLSLKDDLSLKGRRRLFQFSIQIRSQD